VVIELPETVRLEGGAAQRPGDEKSACVGQVELLARRVGRQDLVEIHGVRGEIAAPERQCPVRALREGAALLFLQGQGELEIALSADHLSRAERSRQLFEVESRRLQRNPVLGIEAGCVHPDASPTPRTEDLQRREIEEEHPLSGFHGACGVADSQVLSRHLAAGDGPGEGEALEEIPSGIRQRKIADGEGDSFQLGLRVHLPVQVDQ